MHSHFVQYIVKNIRRVSHPALIIFVLISFGLWYINKLSHVYTTSVTIPVRIENSANSPVGVVDNEHAVECRIEGPGYKLLMYKMFPERHGVTIDFNRIDARPVSGSVSEVTLSSLFNALSVQVTEVKVLSILTPRFEIVTSPLQSKKLPVISRIQVDCASQFMQIHPAVLTPDSLEVKSLSVLLDTMKGIYTERRYFSDVNGSLSGRIPLVVGPDVIVPVKEVEYSIDIEEYTEIDLQLPVSVDNDPEDLVPLVLPDLVSVKLNVCRSKYGDAVPGKVRAYVDYNDRKTNIDKRYKVYVEGGDGIFVKDISPRYVELVFNHKP